MGQAHRVDLAGAVEQVLEQQELERLGKAIQEVLVDLVEAVAVAEQEV
jgi:hypothetical protein